MIQVHGCDSKESCSQAPVSSASVSKCFGIDPGPVHLNWMFREPFDLTSDCGSISYFNKPQHGLISLTANQKTDLAQILERSTAGLIVVGELTNPLEREALKEILKESSWPMIIDASSGLSLLNTPNKISYCRVFNKIF